MVFFGSRARERLRSDYRRSRGAVSDRLGKWWGRLWSRGGGLVGGQVLFGVCMPGLFLVALLCALGDLGGHSGFSGCFGE